MKISSIVHALSLLVVAVNAMPVHEDVTLAKRDADLVDLANTLQNADLLNGVNVLSNQNAKRDLINAENLGQNLNALNSVNVLSNSNMAPCTDCKYKKPATTRSSERQSALVTSWMPRMPFRTPTSSTTSMSYPMRTKKVRATPFISFFVVKVTKYGKISPSH